jgi:hypothetical protein
MNEYQISFISPKCKENLGQILFAEIMFRLHLFLALTIGHTYIVNFASLFFISRSPCDPAEASEEPFCIGIY